MKSSLLAGGGGSATMPERISYREFLRRYPDGQHLEWVDGRAVQMAPVTGEHQDVGGFLLCLMTSFVEERGLGVVLMRPFQMKTGRGLPSRAPDLMSVGKRKRRWMMKYYLDGPADVVIEIADRESRALDRGGKFFEYEEGGVQEYWLIEPERKCAEFYRLADDKRFDRVRIGDDGIFRSVALKGFWLKVDWLWQRPLPKVITVLKEWGLV